MADRSARYRAIRDLAATLPATLANQTLQPKYKPSLVSQEETDQFGLKKDRNAIYTMSLDNYDKASRFGVVFEQYVYLALPRIVDGCCRLATDEEINGWKQQNADFLAAQDANARLKRMAPYDRYPDAAPPVLPRHLVIA
jgi:hypothetical protein